MTKKKRIVFPKEFKLKAVRLVVEQGMSASQVARDLGINPEYVYRWKKEFKEDQLIRMIYKESRCSYGSPGVWRKLRSRGE
jgi:transposase-like protein